MRYEMKMVFPRDAKGNKIYPPPLFCCDDQGRFFEISQIPLYFYMPVPVGEKDGEGTEGKEDAGGDQPDL